MPATSSGSVRAGRPSSRRMPRKRKRPPCFDGSNARTNARSMQPDSREEKNALAFLDYVAGSSGYKLRPASYYTIETMKLLELALIAGKAAWMALDPDAMRDEVHTYLFIQAAPAPRVSRAVRTYRRWRREKAREEIWEEWMCLFVEPFLADLTPEVRAEFEEQLETLDEIDAARVSADPPAGGRRERPDPNSLSP